MHLTTARPGMTVAGTSVALPRRRQRAIEVVGTSLSVEDAERAGAENLPVAGACAGPELAVQAGRDALRVADMDPLSVSVLAHAWLYHQGHDFWSPAHYVAHEVGALRCVPFGIQQMSNGGAMGIDLALRTLSAGGAGSAALVTTGDRFGLPGFDRWRSDYDVAYGDGGTAVVLRKGSPRAGELEVLGMATTAMPELEVMYRAGDAFSDAPLSHASPIDVRRPKRAWLASGGGADLAEKGPRTVEEVLRCALQCAGLTPGDASIRRIAVPRIGSRTIEQMYLPPVRRVLGVDVMQLGQHTGHLGAGDFLANASDFATDGLDAGEVGLVIGGGGGFTLSCLVLRRR